MVALFFWGRLRFSKKLRSSSFLKEIEVVFHFQKYYCFTFIVFGCIIVFEVVFHLKEKFRSSSFFKKLRSSSFSKNIEVVIYISSSWVGIRLHTKNQLPRLPRTAQIVIIPGVVWCCVVLCGVVSLTDNNTTPGDFVLGWPGLWQ